MAKLDHCPMVGDILPIGQTLYEVIELGTGCILKVKCLSSGVVYTGPYAYHLLDEPQEPEQKGFESL